MSKMIKLAMEGMSEIPHREPEIGPIIERRIELTKSLFSENTTVTATSEIDFQVETVLDQGICEGGQKIKLGLTLEKQNLESYMSSVGLEVKPFVQLLVNTFEVNGEELATEENPIHLTSEREAVYNLELLSDEDRQIVENMRKFHENDFFVDGDGGGTDGKDIVLFKIKDGNDLAFFIHEKGHILRESGDIDTKDALELREQIQVVEAALGNLKRFKAISGISYTLIGKKRETGSLDEEISTLTKQVNQLYRKRIFDEKRASIKALEFLKNHPNMFPSDPNNIRAKLVYSAALSTYISDARYRDESLKSEATRIVDFDQDWHY